MRFRFGDAALRLIDRPITPPMLSANGPAGSAAAKIGQAGRCGRQSRQILLRKTLFITVLDMKAVLGILNYVDV